jgi:hypothetical protein
VRILSEGVGRVAAVHRVPLRDAVAIVEDGPDGPILWIDTGSPDGDVAWALLDVLRVLGFGVHQDDTSARPMTRLYSVS